MTIDNSTRITQSMDNRKNMYNLYNSKLGITMDLNFSAYNLILLISKGKINDRGILRKILSIYYSILGFDLSDYIYALKENKIINIFNYQS